MTSPTTLPGPLGTPPRAAVPCFSCRCRVSELRGMVERYQRSVADHLAAARRLPVTLTALIQPRP